MNIKKNYFTDGSYSIYSPELKRFMQKYYSQAFKIKHYFEQLLSDLGFLLLNLNYTTYIISFPSINDLENLRINLFDLQQVNTLINFKYDLILKNEKQNILKKFNFFDFYCNLLFYHYGAELNHFFENIDESIENLLISSQLPLNIKKDFEAKSKNHYTDLLQLHMEIHDSIDSVDYSENSEDLQQLVEYKTIHKTASYFYYKYCFDFTHLQYRRNLSEAFLYRALTIDDDATLSPLALISSSDHYYEFISYMNELILTDESSVKTEFVKYLPIKCMFGEPIYFTELKNANINRNFPLLENKGDMLYFYDYQCTFSELNTNLGFFFSSFVKGSIILNDENLKDYYDKKKMEFAKGVIEVQLFSIFENFLNPLVKHGSIFYFNERKAFWEIKKDVIDFISFYFNLFQRIFSYYPTHPLLLASDPLIYYYFVQSFFDRNLFNDHARKLFYLTDLNHNSWVINSNFGKLDSEIEKVIRNNNEYYRDHLESVKSKIAVGIPLAINNIISSINYLILKPIGFQYTDFNTNEFFPRILNREDFFKSNLNRFTIHYLETNTDSILALIRRIISLNSEEDNEYDLIPFISYIIESCIYCLEEENTQLKTKAQERFISALYSDVEHFMIYYPYEISIYKKKHYLLRFKIPFLIDFDPQNEFVTFYKLELNSFFEAIEFKIIEELFKEIPSFQLRETLFLMKFADFIICLNSGLIARLSERLTEYNQDFAKIYKKGISFFSARTDKKENE